jgi:hypothetical protein
MKNLITAIVIAVTSMGAAAQTDKRASEMADHYARMALNDMVIKQQVSYDEVARAYAAGHSTLTIVSRLRDHLDGYDHCYKRYPDLRMAEAIAAVLKDVANNRCLYWEDRRGR